MTMQPKQVYADEGVADMPGSRWQVVLRDTAAVEGPVVVYCHVNDRGDGVFTLDLNDDECDLDLVVQVTQPEVLRLAHMFLSAAMR
jgi:hypothetical protein